MGDEDARAESSSSVCFGVAASEHFGMCDVCVCNVLMAMLLYIDDHLL